MKKLFLYICFLFYIFHFHGIYINAVKEIIMRNNDDNINTLHNIINNNQNGEGLIINFVDDYYLFDDNVTYRYEISIFYDITIIGNKNGTTLDFNNGRRGAFGFRVSKNAGEVITFENIIFKNYKANMLEPGLEMIRVQATSDKFKLIINNCTFQNTIYTPIYVESKFNTLDNYDDLRVIFNNCNFM